MSGTSGSPGGSGTTTPLGKQPPAPPPLARPVVRPKMGGIITTPSGTQVAHTGGKPKADWTGLENPRSPENPNCVRFPIGTSDESKAYARRTTLDLETPFKKSSDLDSYLVTLTKHIRDHGMDTTLYIPSIVDPRTMIFVPEEFQQVTFDHASEKVQDLKNNEWDVYDKANDAATCKLIEGTLDLDLLEQLRLRQAETDTAIETLLRIVRLVQDQSVERFNRLRDSLKALSPVKEPGQDVVAYCDKARPICNKLFRAKQWEWILLLPIVKALASVSVEAFSAFFTALIMQVDAQLKEVVYLDRDTAAQVMINKNMHYDWFFNKAEDMYRSLADNNEWGPAKMPTGSKNPTQVNFAAFTEAEFNSFVQSQVDKKFNSLKKKREGDDDKGTPKKDGDDKSTPRTGTKWREIPPANGEPQRKHKNGKLFLWCGKCRGGKGLWHNHKTEDHSSDKSTKKKKDGASPTPANDSANLANDSGSDVGVHWSI